MSTYFKILSPLSFIIVLILSSGCEEGTGLVNTQTDLSGQIVDKWGEVAAGVKVWIDNDTIYTDSEGKFFFESIQTPYDLYIVDGSSEVSYSLLDLDNSKIIFELYDNFDYLNTCLLKVTAGGGVMSGIDKANFVFTDGEFISEYGEPGFPLILKLKDKETVHGKLIFLGYKTDQEGNVLSYEKFGIKDVTLTKGGDYNYQFTSSDVPVNPGEKEINGTFLNTLVNPSTHCFVLSFAKNRSGAFFSGTPLGNFNHSNNFSYIIPTLLPIEYFPTIFITSGNASGETQTVHKWIKPHENYLEVRLGVPSELISPSSGSDVTIETPFSYTLSGENKFAIVNISDGQKKYRIYTNKPSITLKDIEPLGFRLTSNIYYDWYVAGISGYNLNEFLNDPYNIDVSFLQSKYHLFKRAE